MLDILHQSNGFVELFVTQNILERYRNYLIFGDGPVAAILDFTATSERKNGNSLFAVHTVNICEKTQLFKICMKKSQNDIVTYTRTIGYVHHIVENGSHATNTTNTALQGYCFRVVLATNTVLKLFDIEQIYFFLAPFY